MTRKFTIALLCVLAVFAFACKNDPPKVERIAVVQSRAVPAEIDSVKPSITNNNVKDYVNVLATWTDGETVTVTNSSQVSLSVGTDGRSVSATYRGMSASTELADGTYSDFELTAAAITGIAADGTVTFNAGSEPTLSANVAVGTETPTAAKIKILDAKATKFNGAAVTSAQSSFKVGDTAEFEISFIRFDGGTEKATLFGLCTYDNSGSGNIWKFAPYALSAKVFSPGQDEFVSGDSGLKTADLQEFVIAENGKVYGTVNYLRNKSGYEDGNSVVFTLPAGSYTVSYYPDETATEATAVESKGGKIVLTFTNNSMSDAAKSGVTIKSGDADYLRLDFSTATFAPMPTITGFTFTQNKIVDVSALGTYSGSDFPPALDGIITVTATLSDGDTIAIPADGYPLTYTLSSGQFALSYQISPSHYLTQTAVIMSASDYLDGYRDGLNKYKLLRNLQSAVASSGTSGLAVKGATYTDGFYEGRKVLTLPLTFTNYGFDGTATTHTRLVSGTATLKLTGTEAVTDGVTAFTSTAYALENVDFNLSTATGSTLGLLPINFRSESLTGGFSAISLSSTQPAFSMTVTLGTDGSLSEISITGLTDSDTTSTCLGFGPASGSGEVEKIAVTL